MSVSYKNLFSNRILNLFRNASWKFGSNAVEYGAAFVQAILLARFLGVKNYGFLVLISAYITIINKIVDFRVWESVVKFVSEYKEKNDRQRTLAVIKLSYLIDSVTGVIAFLIVFLTAGWISIHLLKQPKLEMPIIIFALTLLVGTVKDTSTALHRVYGRFRRLGFIESVFSVCSLVFVSVTLIFISRELTAVLWALVAASVINNLFLNVSAVNIIKPVIKGVWKIARISMLKERFREMANFLFQTSFNNLLTLFTQDADVMILNYFYGPAAVGIFKVGKKMAKSFSFLITPLYFVFYPDIAALWSSGEDKKIRSYIKEVSVILAVIGVIITVLLYACALPLISVLFGSKYISAVPVLRIMVWGTFISLVFMWVRPFFLSIGRPGTVTWATLFSAICLVILSLIVVPKYGYMGSAAIFVVQKVALYLFGLMAYFYYYKEQNHGVN